MPPTAVGAVMVAGTPEGVTLAEGGDGNPFPTTFVANTVKVYAVPFVNPVTVRGLPAPVLKAPPGFAVTR